MEITIKSINPFTGELIKEFTPFNKSQIESSIELADLAFNKWRKTAFEERATVLQKVAKNLEEQKEQLAKTITLEMGKPITEAISEVEKCAWVCKYYAKNATGFLTEEIIDTDAEKSYVSYEPLGCILAIMPWNFPLWQVFRFAAPSLMAGNVALLKHAPNVTLCAQAIEEVFKESGLPENCFTTLIAEVEQVENIIRHPVVKGVTLTGSVAAGSAVAKIAAEEIKPTVLELGGSNPFIVLPDADLEKASSDAIIGRFLNNGQSCIAAKRLMLHESIYTPFMDLFLEKVKALKVGNPLEKETQTGPMVSKKAATRLHTQIQNSLKKGAKLTTGGTHKNAMYQPTVLEKVKPGMPAFDEELFGPCANVMKVSSLEEAIALGNQTEYGLGVSIYTQDLESAMTQLNDIEDGAVFLNSIVKSDPRLPFGGTKKSGYGRELSRDGIMEFVNKKTVYIA